MPNGPPLGTIGDWRCSCGFISKSVHVIWMQLNRVPSDWRRRAMCKNCYPLQSASPTAL